MSDLTRVVEHDDGAIAEILLNRADKRNALNQELLDEMRATVKEVTSRQDVRVVVLGGEGRSFCAGMDLQAVRTQPEQMGSLLKTLSLLMREIRRAPQPFIARVQGAAIGGGCGLMCVCDFSFTHPDSKIGYPEVDLGICPAVVAPWLVWRIGSGKARQLLLAGGTLRGEEMYEYGLVTHLVDMDDVCPGAMACARRLARGGTDGNGSNEAMAQ
ncbi:MAG: enoyl-CoA hydratase/isomerase family protein [Planctomycetes bacterium]|nr:enoyl-CoA hydratase/isomerase family protein [Planctomycetota bacterium]